jgi:hypothetical protein
MSKYLKIATQFKDEDTFREALEAVCNERGIQYEAHDEAARLVGYQGDLRDETAHYIVRRGYIGRSSNDLEFRRKGGEVVAVISEFDNRKGSRDRGVDVLNHVKREYATRQVKKIARRRGMEVEEVREHGVMRLRLVPKRGRRSERRVRVRR